VQPGAQFCDICGQPSAAYASGGVGAAAGPDQHSMTPLGAPPPSADSRQGWHAPPPDIHLPPINPDQEDDPWASWYGKPRGQRRDTPSATLPRVQQPGYGPGPGQPYAEGPQYDGAPQYGATEAYGGQPYSGQQYPGQQPGAQQYPEQPYPGQQHPEQPYPGQQHPDQQYGGSQQYGQYNGPMAGGQEYSGGQYGGGPEYPGAMPYADSQPYPPGGPRSRARGRGRLIPALAIGGVALIAIVALVVANSGGGSPSPNASTGSSGATISAPPVSDAAQKAAAQRLAALLPPLGDDHATVVGAVGDLDGCKHLKPARTDLGTVTQNRDNLLAQLRTLPGRSALPADLMSALTDAEQASAQVDGHLHDWAQDLINGGCDPKTARSDPQYQASLGGDSIASSDKAKFVSLWNPLAKKYGLATYQVDQL
jgi:hypothetical protein